MDVHRFTGHETEPSKSKALAINKKSSLMESNAFCILAFLCENTAFILVFPAHSKGHALATHHPLHECVMFF
jgi:hypothetical protein